ncbi:hypothetical protein OU995_11790 [Roseateles sp. SL47]|uniref:hypothetical protein n=1 Tax=Roseateles sp. SL47 TaxID=2995138 RepID=UPI0022721660|nr:hypothetical protein [Roseateles sp. SL47]WAC75330.1 hypothetical protein OU995_11790 [Roseateles sp. SL47]
MTKADPLSATRRQRLQAYCKKKGWQNENGTWAIKEIGQHLKKPPQKISDLLNGRGAFGAKIARDLEDASEGGLPPGYLDDLAQLDSVIPDVLPGFEPAPASQQLILTFNTSVLADGLLRLDETSRQEAANSLSELAKFPDSGLARERAAKVLGKIEPMKVRVSATSVEPTWRDSAVEVFTELWLHGKHLEPAALVSAIDAVHSERITQTRAMSAQPGKAKA